MPLSKALHPDSVPCFAWVARRHVGLLTVVSGRSIPTSPSKVTLLYHHRPFAIHRQTLIRYRGSVLVLQKMAYSQTGQPAKSNFSSENIYLLCLPYVYRSMHALSVCPSALPERAEQTVRSKNPPAEAGGQPRASNHAYLTGPIGLHAAIGWCSAVPCDYKLTKPIHWESDSHGSAVLD